VNNQSRLSVILVIFASLFGCQSMVQYTKELPMDSSVPSLIPYQLKAIDYEKNNELQLALTNWRIAEALMNERIRALTEHIGNNAEKHFQRGLTCLNDGLIDQARLEFLTTLRYESDHSDALKCLRKAVNPKRTIEYTVKKDDSFKTIANQVYKNNNQNILVAFFSGLESEKDLVEGLVLSLPVLEVEFTKRFFNYHKEMALARKYFKDKDFIRVLPIAENIVKHMPDNREAVFMINSSYDGLAEALFKKQKYNDAIDMLKMIDPKFRNVKPRIMEIQGIQARHMATDTENKNAAHYRDGRDFFKKEMYIESLKAFEYVDSGYADVVDKIAELNAIMKNESEIHYRKGVKHFLNEKLDEAILEWEKALAFDPENLKVQKDIDNAKQLLKKIDEIK